MFAPASVIQRFGWRGYGTIANESGREPALITFSKPQMDAAQVFANAAVAALQAGGKMHAVHLVSSGR